VDDEPVALLLGVGMYAVFAFCPSSCRPQLQPVRLRREYTIGTDPLPASVFMFILACSPDPLERLAVSRAHTGLWSGSSRSRSYFAHAAQCRFFSRCCRRRRFRSGLRVDVGLVVVAFRPSRRRRERHERQRPYHGGSIGARHEQHRGPRACAPVRFRVSRLHPRLCAVNRRRRRRRSRPSSFRKAAPATSVTEHVAHAELGMVAVHARRRRIRVTP